MLRSNILLCLSSPVSLQSQSNELQYNDALVETANLMDVIKLMVFRQHNKGIKNGHHLEKSLAILLIM